MNSSTAVSVIVIPLFVSLFIFFFVLDPIRYLTLPPYVSHRLNFTVMPTKTFHGLYRIIYYPGGTAESRIGDLRLSDNRRILSAGRTRERGV